MSEPSEEKAGAGEATGGEAPTEVSVEELERLIREAQDLPYVTKDTKKNILCVQWGKRKVKCVPYDPKLEERLKAIAEEVRASMRGKTAGTALTSTTDVGIWLASIKGRRPLVEHLVEKLTWAQKAFLEVGVSATLAVLMASGVPPDKVEEHVYRFKNDPEALTMFVLDKLENFIVAATSQQDLLKCRNDVAERDVYIAYLESELEKAYNEIRAMYDRYKRLAGMYRLSLDLLKLAAMLMPEDKLATFTQIAFAMYGFETPPTQMGEKGAGGA